MATDKELLELLKQALSFHQKSDLANAEAYYKRILKDKPSHPDALHLLGVIAHQRGNHKRAIELIKRALLNNRFEAGYYNNLGEAHRALKDFENAIACYKKAIQQNADFKEAWNNLGNVHFTCGRLEEAVASFKRALTIQPNYAEACNNLGNVLTASGYLNAAVDRFRHAIKINREFAEAHNNLSNTLNAQGKHAEAIVSAQCALAQKPNFPEAYNNQGIALNALGRFKEAVDNFQRALDIRADYAEAYSNLLLAMNYQPEISIEALYKKHCAWAKAFAHPTLDNPVFDIDRSVEKRLRIGYVSPDFRAHSVAYFLEPILANHDKKRFKVYCYSAVVYPDGTTERLKTMTDNWVSIVGQSDDDVAKRLHEDKIDILVDLSGHTANNRLLLFARRLAPIQVTYLGYPNTTGLQTMDYRLTDDYADPEGGTEKWYTEKLVKLNSTAWCYRPPENTPEINKLPVEEKGVITFGSFNASYKLNENVFRLWTQILTRVARSRLLIKSKSLADPAFRERINKQFLESGISHERLMLQPHEPTHWQHMERYHEIDIVFDSFPYHGTTTTCEALYMGIPVVTLEGRDHRSRVGVSLLNQVNLQSLIARTEEEYVAIACSLAYNVDELAELRNNLRTRMGKSPLMDEAGYTQGIENAHREMWRKWCDEQ